MTESNIVPHLHTISKTERNKLTGNSSLLIWFTGLSGSGKSTLANKLEQVLHTRGILTYILDGDNIRSGLNKDLDFSEAGRVENIRRIGEVAKLMTDAGLVVLTAFISPFKEDRNTVRQLLNDGQFIEIYVKCDLSTCEERDVKGLYSKAREGKIINFTGIDSPYEEPENPEITVDTSELNIDDCIEKIYKYIEPKLRINK
ncbi:MAG TPA: adenylyl-sulfate kinase [Ignavibacteria bacterium]|nr:adenylyl-sulfate kinase [Ignavibacteria bacterium]HMR42077.1 adenylyl-sulfate kinase [Ignavibacteria bacterium]